MMTRGRLFSVAEGKLVSNYANHPLIFGLLGTRVKRFVWLPSCRQITSCANFSHDKCKPLITFLC